ncbi:MAG: hypothetical protein DRI92_05855, partial [Aquificota bacterium]
NVKPFLAKNSDLKKTFDKYNHLDGKVLPAMGYSEKELRELERLIKRINPEVIVTGTPVDISHVIKVEGYRMIRATYELEITEGEGKVLTLIKSVIE